MQEESFQIEDNIPDTNFLIYKNKSYPIKLDYFKYLSSYFTDNQLKFETQKNIPLVDEKIENEDILTDEGIKSFIKYAQHQSITLTNETVHTLSYLSDKYDIPSLKSKTSKYIEDHQKELLLEILTFNSQNSTEDKKIYEDILSDNILQHIEDDRLFQLKLPSIYRILMRYEDNHKKNENKGERDKIFEFLFKCLDKYGRKASVLFSIVDFGHDKMKHLKKLSRDYSKIFDFHFIEKDIVEEIYDEENKIMIKKISDEEKLIKQEKLIHSLEQIIYELKNELSEVKSIQSQLNSKMINEIESNQQKQEIIINQLREENQTNRNRISELELKNSTLQQQINSKCQEEIQKLKEITDKHESKLNELYIIKGSIIAKVETNQSITGTIKIQCNENCFDKKRSKFIINTINLAKLNQNDYAKGENFHCLSQQFSFDKPSGTYYVHALIFNKLGSFEELISEPLTTNGIQYTFDYTGKVQSITLNEGTYQIEAWGAEGGQNNKNVNCGTYKGYAGKGGYSVGTISLTSETTLYVHVGGTSDNGTGGWNGGGAGLNGGAGGGGSTDVSLYGNAGSSEWNTADHLYSRIIVAGGGGGSSHTDYPGWIGGNGGGLEGEQDGHGYVEGGKQTSGYGFGFGEANTTQNDAGGGGGWYGGYSCNNGWWGLGGGGGSGYVYNSSTASSYPSGCKLNSSFYLTDSSTTCGNTDIPNTAGIGTEKGHCGNGFVKITAK